MNVFDPFGVTKVSLDIWKAMLAQPASLFDGQAGFMRRWMELVDQSFSRASGQPSPDLVAPAKGDKRFADPAWTENPALDALKQAYLIATETTMSMLSGVSNVDPATVRRAQFFAKQFTDAISPSNFAWVNPVVVQETIRTGGQNLVRGMQNLLQDITENEGRVALVDTSAFEVGKNIATSEGTVVFRNELIELIQYAPRTETVHTTPLVIIPPWINKFYILDLQPENSLIKYATEQGITTFVVSWRNPDASLADFGMDDYLELGAHTACRVAKAIAGSDTVNTIGYCIGGTLLAILLSYLAKTGEELVNAATFFASLTDFSDPGEIINFLGDDAIELIEKKMAEKGYLTGRDMGDTFNMLRANDLIWSVAVNRYLLGKDAPAFDLLYWNQDATRMPLKMHSFYLREMYLANKLVEPGAIVMNDVPIDLGDIHNDCYIVATQDDHIAPWRSVYRLTQSVRGKTRFRLGHSGHIAGIVNPPGNKKPGFWYGREGTEATINPPDPEVWRETAPKHDGSWWNDWSAWLAERSGELVASRTAGSLDAYPAIVDAPGAYVLE